jgi:hypothetical protein
MKPLEEVIGQWTHKSFDGFLKFLKARGGRKGVLDLSLAKSIRRGNFSADDFVLMAYGELDNKNRAAYHGVRKRLAQQTVRYISEELLNEDQEAEKEIFESIRASRYLAKNGHSEWANSLLQRADRLSEQGSMTFMQNWVLNERISMAGEEDEAAVLALEEERKQRIAEVELEQRMMMARTHLQVRLRERKKSGQASSPMSILQNTLLEYDLLDDEVKKPKLMHQLTVMMRAVLVASKEFDESRAFLYAQNELISNAGGYEGDEQEVEMAYFLAHADYRCRKYDLALQRMPELYQMINSLQVSRRHFWFSKVVLLEAQTRNFSGQLLKAQELLLEMLSHPAFGGVSKERYNLILNLAVLYFQLGFFDKVLETFKLFRHRTQWHIEYMGLEWVLKKQMIEVIALVELHEDQRAMEGIQKIQSLSEEFFSQRPYRRVLLFLEWVQRYLSNREAFSGPLVLDRLVKSLAVQSDRKEDLQAVAYYTWLKSKAEGRSYYELLLEMVRGAEV